MPIIGHDSVLHPPSGQTKQQIIAKSKEARIMTWTYIAQELVAYILGLIVRATNCGMRVFFPVYIKVRWSDMHRRPHQRRKYFSEQVRFISWSNIAAKLINLC
jgi:ATP:corrinoid adenosyltransferase